MNRIKTAMTGLIAGIALAAATTSLADQEGGMGHGMEHGNGHGMGHHGAGHHGMMDGADRSARIESHLTGMKTQLQITASQEPAWQAYTAAMKQQAAGMQAMHAQMQQGAGNAADRMAQHSAAMQQQGAAMATVSNAFKSLYATLTPEQRTVADQSFGKMSQRGKGAGHRQG